MEKHSNLLKRFASGDLDTFSALKTLKVLLKDIGDENLIKWVNCEINGYDIKDPNIPAYRKTQGYVEGSIATRGAIYHNQCIPTHCVPEELLENLLTASFECGVMALETLVEQNNGALIKPVTVDYYPYFFKALGHQSIAQINVRFDDTVPANILSCIENRILDIFYLLEQQGCDLDEMNVANVKNTNIVATINQLIYSDNHITIGDGNEFAKTTLQTH